MSPEGDKFLTEQIEQKTTPAGDTPATPVEKKESTSTPTKRWKCIHPDFVEFTHLLDKKEVEEVIASGIEGF